MKYENNKILIDKLSGKVAKLTLNSPPLNLMSIEATIELKESMKKLLSDDEVNAIVLCGSTRAFCAGSNLKEVPLYENDPVDQKTLRENQTFNLFEFGDKFTIAAIDGVALGGGLEIALACDMRVMARDAVAALPEINSGLRPGSACFRLPKLVGPGKALEMMLLGEFLDAEQCLEIGLINRLAEPGKAVDAAIEIATTVARRSQHGVKLIRKSVRELWLKTSEECFWENLHYGEEIYEKDDWREGVTAFMEKRKPNFFNPGQKER